MSDEHFLERAKADKANLQSQVQTLDREMQRMQHLKNAHVVEIGKLTAFIEVHTKYAAERPQPPTPEAAEAGEEAPVADAAPEEPKPKPKAKRRKGNPVKPKTAPPMPDMIMTALLDARVHGRSGLTPAEMRDHIAKKWWPHVKAGQISPIAWRMFDRGDLHKEGSVYMIPSENEPEELQGITPDEMRERGIIPMQAKVIGEA
jgi:hypothetical protein